MTPELINGIEYPQNSKTLYSGTGNSAYSFPRALRGMLGFNEADYYSFTARKVMKYLVKGKIKPGSKLVDYTIYEDLIKSTKRNNILISLIQNCFTSGISLNTPMERESALKEIMDEYFLTIGHQEIQENFVSYIKKIKIEKRDVKVLTVHNNRIIWPSETVYSSVHQFVSMLYGKNTVIFNEMIDPQSVDMGFWNYKKNGYWYESHKDVGEFVAGGLIPAKLITGFQLREETGRIYIKSRMKFVPIFDKISYAFFKEKVNDEEIVVAVKNSTMSGCIQRVAPFKYNFCEHSYSVETMDEILVKPSRIKKQIKKCRKKDEGIKQLNCLKKLDLLVGEISKNPNRPAKVLRQEVPIIGYFTKITVGTNLAKELLNRNIIMAPNKDELKWFKKIVKKAWLENKVKFVPIK
jgi:hypothetical protein